MGIKQNYNILTQSLRGSLKEGHSWAFIIDDGCIGPVLRAKEKLPNSLKGTLLRHVVAFCFTATVCLSRDTFFPNWLKAFALVVPPMTPSGVPCCTEIVLAVGRQPTVSLACL